MGIMQKNIGGFEMAKVTTENMNKYEEEMFKKSEAELKRVVQKSPNPNKVAMAKQMIKWGKEGRKIGKEAKKNPYKIGIGGW